ncbi:hypothetical protein K431DRAFT_322306 [Polychaeton citri CBS 116435]|uniref:RING-type domain-containing protein n=1 Tax=Polychaeton citri CBS 116435 TaxID=1314669 RepID=A0A9P4Q544_9PEZI|nr:hypothetical protein K431DRAFT_322306 [Polychaeton citri CBS 116435]
MGVAGDSEPSPGVRSRSRKRKATVEGCEVIDLTEDTSPKRHRPSPYNDEFVVSPKRKGKSSQKNPPSTSPVERRQRRYRPHAPTSYLHVRDRALTQRMFVVDRERDNKSNPDHPVETISLAGSIGNIYTIVVDKVPSCDCPHARKGNQCKHIAYVMTRVLRAPSDLEYQLAFISSELRDIFASSPPLPSETVQQSGERDGKRKPLEGECPICCVDFEPQSPEAIVYCQAACGNNIHKACFEQWAATKKGSGITCPFCRALWQSDNATLKTFAKSGARNEDGYVNIAKQLGISGRRDYSSYHPFWVSRQIRRGNFAWDGEG